MIEASPLAVDTQLPYNSTSTTKCILGQAQTDRHIGCSACAQLGASGSKSASIGRLRAPQRKQAHHSQRTALMAIQAIPLISAMVKQAAQSTNCLDAWFFPPASSSAVIN